MTVRDEVTNAWSALPPSLAPFVESLPDDIKKFIKEEASKRITDATKDLAGDYVLRELAKTASRMGNEPIIREIYIAMQPKPIVKEKE